MRLLRVGDPGHERPAVEDGDAVFDLSSLTDDIDGTFLADDGVLRARDALRSGEPASPGHQRGSGSGRRSRAPPP